MQVRPHSQWAHDIDKNGNKHWCFGHISPGIKALDHPFNSHVTPVLVRFCERIFTFVVAEYPFVPFRSSAYRTMVAPVKIDSQQKEVRDPSV